MHGLFEGVTLVLSACELRKTYACMYSDDRSCFKENSFGRAKNHLEAPTKIAGLTV